MKHIKLYDEDITSAKFLKAGKTVAFAKPEAPKMTVAKLIEQLKKLPQDAEPVFHWKGAPSDAKIKGANPQNKTDKERNQITISGY